MDQPLSGTPLAPDTTYDPALAAADLHNYASTGQSFMDDAGNFLLKGVPLAVASGLYSMYNTGVSLGNSLGGDFQKASLQEDVKGYDDNLGSYYQEHEEGIDLGGFVATSMIPGIAGLKALKLIQAGNLGKNAAQVTNLFRSAEADYLAKATSSIQYETNAVFATFDANKIGAIAAGYGEQALQAAAFETATMLTMNQSPVINKDDQAYFQNLLYNSPDMLKNVLVGGGIGGSLHAFGVSGKLKGLIKARDAEDFPSIHIEEAGMSNLDQGTLAGLDFFWLKSRQAQYEADAAAGKLNDRQVLNFTRTQDQKENELRQRITQQLSEGDKELGKQVWEHLNGLKDQAPSGQLASSAEDIATTILGAATKISRVNEADLPGLVETVLHGDVPLAPRYARNILKYAAANDKMAPDVYPAMDNATAFDLNAAGYVLYKDGFGNTRVVPGTKYASQFKRSVDATEHDLVLKLKGDQAGSITETAFPTIGDLGKVALSKKGELLVQDVPREVPEYNPLSKENTPLDSNAAFVKAQLGPKLPGSEAGVVKLAPENIPMIEKAYKDGSESVVHGGNIEVEGGHSLNTLKDTLFNLKSDLRQQLVQAGHSFDQIARELNVSREFAETGTGEFALSKIEDHRSPQYAKISYNTETVPDKTTMRGALDLLQRISIARQYNQGIAAQILKDAYPQFPQTKGTLMGINTLPELGGFVKSANEDYGTTGQLFQQVGKLQESLTRKRFAERWQQISGLDASIRNSEPLTIELNQLVAKVRSSNEPLMLEDGMIMPKSIYESLADPAADTEQILNDGIKNGRIYEVKSPEVLDYITSAQQINTERARLFNLYFGAKGSKLSWDPDALYLPAINTSKYPFIAYVRETAETEFRPVSVVVAQNAKDLEAKVRKIQQEFPTEVDVYTQQGLKDTNALRGEYENSVLDGRNSTLGASLAKRGILSEFAPRTDAGILDEFTAWHWQQEQTLVRAGIELQYSQEFAELRAMGQQFAEFSKSVVQDAKVAGANNPYYRYISTALGLSQNSRYDSVWGRLNSGVEALGRTMFGIWDTMFKKAQNGEIDWATANAEAERAGFRPPYQDPLREIWNPVIQNKKVLEPIVQKANAAVATLVLRFDPLNAIVNILGTPALIASELSSIRRNITDPAVVGKLAEALQVGVPGGKYQLPSTLKLATNALGNFIKDDNTLLTRYQSFGAVQTDLQLYKNAMDATSLSVADLKDVSSIKAWTDNLAAKASQVGAQLTGNALSERMVRFVAANIMDQICEIAQVPASEIPAYINTFVNRVHGNFVASQRPALFQGVVGSAISLFQTYQFNVMQNMVRYLERDDKVAVATLLGLQNTLFGIQGNPAYYLLNSYIGNQNREHVDLTSGAYAVVGKDVGDWLMYGLGANALKTNLYNRGDLTPRYVTVVPTNITDSPAISITGKAISNVLDTMQNIWKGGSVPESIMNGIAHNGFNRPLSGIAQLAQGYRTSPQGNLMHAYHDIDGWGIAGKVMGGEPLNNAIADDAYYRAIGYKAKDKEKIAQVGEAIKTKLYGGKEIDPEDIPKFMMEYSRAGGRVEGVNKFMIGAFKDANQSQVNKMFEGLKSPNARNLGRIMGGVPAEDFYNNPPAATKTPPE